MSAVNPILAILWLAAFFHAAAHEDVNTTVIFLLIAVAINIGAEVMVELSRKEMYAELVWRVFQVIANCVFLGMATHSVGDVSRCSLFS